MSGKAPGLSDLGIVPETVEAMLPTYLYRFRKGGQFAADTAPGASRPA